MAIGRGIARQAMCGGHDPRRDVETIGRGIARQAMCGGHEPRRDVETISRGIARQATRRRDISPERATDINHQRHISRHR